MFRLFWIFCVYVFWDDIPISMKNNIAIFIGLCWICRFSKDVHFQILAIVLHKHGRSSHLLMLSFFLEINIIQAFFVHLQSYCTGTHYFVLFIYTDKREDKKNQCFSYVFLEITMVIFLMTQSAVHTSCTFFTLSYPCLHTYHYTVLNSSNLCQASVQLHSAFISREW